MPPVGRTKQALGAAGEERAAAWYLARGYEVLDRNWRCRRGELDLVLARRGELVFCEVKTRSGFGFGLPAEAVTIEKQKRIRRLAMLWIDHNHSRRRRIRFDVASVVGRTVEVIERAF